MITVQGAKTFAQIWPGIPINRDDAYFHHDRAPARIRLQSSSAGPRWRAVNSSGAPVAVAPDSTIGKPASAGWIEVEDGNTMVRIWFMKAAANVRSQHSITAGNPHWPVVQQSFRTTYGAPSYDFTQLGLIQFNSSGQSMNDTFAGRRYGGMVEIRGQVTPADARSSGMQFYLARRITGGAVISQDGQGRPLPPNRDARMPVPAGGSDDTSRPQPGTLTPAGELFDYDFPGSVMRPANQVSDRHIINVSFEQCVVIGTPPPPGVNPWPRITSLGLAVSPLVTWRAAYTATVTRAISNTRSFVELSLTGSVG